MFKLRLLFLMMLGVAGVLSGCSDEPQHQSAIAVIHPTKGNTVQGVVQFTQANGGVRVQVDLSGLSKGKHGFHIHHYGDCSAVNAISAGGHFQPRGYQHGGPEKPQRHVGDLGNIFAEEDGKSVIDRIDKVISLSGLHSIIGRSVVVHEKTDDFHSQPTGGAGPRIGCGVIGIGK